MPILNQVDSTRIFFPTENYEVARYLNLSKFLSLIQTEKIFFNKLTNFEDKFEGSINSVTIQNFANKMARIIGDGESAKKQITNSLKNFEYVISTNKNLTCVSCWNKYKSESYALWKIYSNINQGIMIKTSVDKILLAFKNVKENIFLSEVRYLDYNKEFLNMHDLYFPIIHKNLPYNYEDEIRLFFTVERGNKGLLEHDWTLEDNPNGRYIKIDLNELIEEIIVSPFAPKWFFESVQDLVKQYDLNKIVKYSEFK